VGWRFYDHNNSIAPRPWVTAREFKKVIYLSYRHQLSTGGSDFHQVDLFHMAPKKPINNSLTGTTVLCSLWRSKIYYFKNVIIISEPHNPPMRACKAVVGV
jgi:hypothetical protein